MAGGRFGVACVVAGGLVWAGVLAPAPAQAKVSAECWAHLAGVKTANTPAADRRYHLERGQASPCTEQDAQDNYGPYQERQASRNEEQQKPVYRDDEYDRHQSRWEDKTSFDCGWSWRGGFGC